MTPTAEKTQKMTNIFKKPEEFVKISIRLRVFNDGLFERSYGGMGVHQGTDGEGGGVRNRVRE